MVSDIYMSGSLFDIERALSEPAHAREDLVGALVQRTGSMPSVVLGCRGSDPLSSPMAGAVNPAKQNVQRLSGYTWRERA